MAMSAEILIYTGLVFLFAAFVHGSIGFAFPMISTSLLALVTDIQTAIILTLIPTILVNLVTIATEGGFVIALRQHKTLALLAMLGSAAGTHILIYNDSDIFKGLLAFAIIFYLVMNKVNIRLSWVRTYPKLSRTFFGLSAGVLGGLTNVMAPILIIYSIESRYTKKEVIQSSNICFLMGKIIQLFLFTLYGQFSLQHLSVSSGMVVVVAVALYFGVAVKKRINADLYIKILKVLLLILALTLLVKIV